MKFRTKLITGTALVVGIGALTVSATAQTTESTAPQRSQTVERKEREERGMRREHMRGMRYRGHRMMRMLRGIELTDGQKEQIKVIMEANRMDDGTRQELKSIMEARRAGAVTEAQKVRIKAIHEQQEQRAQLIRTQIEAILTPEQRQQIEARKKEMKERRQQMIERRKEMKMKRDAEKKASETKQ